jgi:hypothetical protein
VLLGWAKALEDLAVIAPQMEETQRALDAALGREKPLTDGINAVCAP